MTNSYKYQKVLYKKKNEREKGEKCMKRKLVSCLLSMAMMVAMVMPVSAAELTAGDVDVTDGSAKVEVGGVVEEPTIDVVVTAANQIVLNPYNLEVTVGEEEEPITDAIVGVDTTITNQGVTGLYVDVTVTGTVGEGSKAVFLTADPEVKPVTTKGVYMWGEFSETYKTGEDVVATFADEYDSKVDFLVGTKALTKTAVVNLANAGEEGSENTNNVSFRLVGKANGDAAEVWTEADTVSVAVIFSFRPTTVGMVAAE